MPCRRALLWLSLSACCLAGGAIAQDDDITVYRCTDARGHLTLQDAPCAKDQSQQTRTMLQPQDPPARAAPVVEQPALQPQPERIVVLRESRPMYECVRADGSRYTSNDGDGDPRWVATGGWWPYASPPSASGIVYQPATSTVATAAATSTVATAPGGSAGNGAPPLRFSSVPRGQPPSRPPPRPGHGPGHGHDRGFGYGYGGGMWVRDDCNVLPQAETCSRLRDRREEIRRRFFNAQQTERATLGTEERGINARLSEDCGGA